MLHTIVTYNMKYDTSNVYLSITHPNSAEYKIMYTHTHTHYTLI